MWNFMDLNCPSDDMVEYETQGGNVDELRDIVNTLTEAANILTSENSIWEEMYVLQNIQVKYKRLLRCDKCLVHLHRVSQCLKKMVLLNLSKSYLDLAERFLMGFSSHNFYKHIRLPSLQQLEYILIRTLSATKLLCDGIKYSRETFCFLLQKIKIGHMILDLVMAASLTANVILKGILEQICNIYQKMLPWRSKLKKGNFEWSEKVDFPEDVKMWLESFASGILKPIPMSRKDMKRLSSLLNKSDLIIDSDTDSVVIVEEVQNNENHLSDQTQNGNSTDYGEVIPRRKRKQSNSSVDQQKALLFKINQVQNMEDLEDLWNEIKSLSSTCLPTELSNRKKKLISEFLKRLKQTLNASKKPKNPRYFKNALIYFMKHLGFTLNEIKMCNREQAVSNIVSPSRGKQQDSNGASPSRGKQQDSNGASPSRGKQQVSNGASPSRGEQQVSNGVSPSRGKQQDSNGASPSRGKQQDSNGASPSRGKQQVSNGASPSRDIDVVSESPSPSGGALVPVRTLKELKLLYKHLCNILLFTDRIEQYRKLQKIFKRRRTDIRLLRQNGEKDTAKQLIFCTSKVFLTLCQK